MPQLRKDPVTGRWVIINVETPKTAFDVANAPKSSRTCPFCPGNEAMTPPPIATVGRKSDSKAPDWQLRVIPNKFPALKIEETPERTAIGVYDRVGGFGAHEVIIETPDHHLEFADFAQHEAETVIRAYRDRCLDLRKDSRLKYILIFKNYGQASGASLEHPHSQLIALPVVPSRVLSELKGAAEHFEYAERCLFCDMLKQEGETGKKFTVWEEEGFIAVTPFASRFPYETWILPQKHEASFDSLSESGIKGVAKVLRGVLGKLKRHLNDPPFNYMIHTLPIQGKESDSYHWHIEIIPHLMQVAGFELGTGFYVNPTPPEMAADKLRNSA